MENRLIQSANASPPATDASDHADGEAAYYKVSTALYSNEAVFRACYQFTDRCFLFLQPAEDGILVEFRKRHPSTDLNEMVGSFANELINQRVRADIARETLAIRELIVSQAFAGADFREQPS